PFCSVIVPTYRRPSQLRECLAALAELDYPRGRFEVIVVADGGGVSPEALAETLGERVRATLLSGPRAGPAAARNAGAARARGELLAFTDDDCRPARSWLRRLAERHLEQPERALGGHTVNALAENVFSAASQLVI